MTEKEALKILAQQEKRFKDAGFGRGVVLAKSAHDYHKALLEWRRKSDACAAEYNAAKKRLDAFTAELGKGKVFSAAEGIGNPSWKMKRSKLSKRATTSWDELITVR